MSVTIALAVKCASVSERENGLEYLRVIDKKSGKSTRIPTQEEVGVTMRSSY